MALAGGPFQFVRKNALNVFVGVQERNVLADHLIALVAVNALGPHVPSSQVAPCIQQEQRKILHPGRNTLPFEIFVCPNRSAADRYGRRLIAQHQQMAYRQDVPFCCVLDVPRGSVWTHQLKRPFLFALP